MTTFWVGDDRLKGQDKKTFRRPSGLDFCADESGEFSTPEAAPTPVSSERELVIDDSEKIRRDFDGRPETDEKPLHPKTKKRVSILGPLDLVPGE